MIIPNRIHSDEIDKKFWELADLKEKERQLAWLFD
jgi:hypothetical protein